MSNDKTNIDYDMVSLSRQIALLEQRSRRLSTKDDPHGGLMDADEADALRRVRARLQQAEAGCERLRREVEMLRLYGNKDCTAMADEALATPPPEDETEHWVGTWDEQADVPLCDWKPGMRKGEDALAENNNALYHLGFLLRSSNADHQSLRRCDEVIRPYLTASGVPEEVRRLAFRCLWIAFAWNDHNFSRNPEKYAREEAEAVGITSAEEAGQFMSQIASAPAVPDGWKLVPVEPTPKMVDATWGHDETKTESHNTRNHRIWSAMIAAAPADGSDND